MSMSKAAVVLALVTLAASACGSGRHIKFSTYSQVCGLSVPMPVGFHRRFWDSNGGGGVTIGDGTVGLGNPAEWVDDPNRVTLAVATPGVSHGPTAAPHTLQFPITLDELERGSGGLTYWSGGGQVGSGNQSHECGVAVWLGPNASSADRSAVLSALQAIKQQG